MTDTTALGLATTVVATLAGAIGALYLRVTKEHDRAVARIAQLEATLDAERKAAIDEARGREDFIVKATERVRDELEKIAKVAEVLSRMSNRT